MAGSSESSSETLNLKTLQKNPWRRRNLFNTAMTVLSGACLCLTLIPLVLVLVFVLIRGVGRIDVALFTQLPPSSGGAGGGVANAMLGTMIVVAIATLIAMPLGIMAAVYVSEFSDGRPIARWVRFCADVLSGVPAIISGVFVYALLVQTGVTGYSAIAGGASLAVLMLPTIIRTTDEALRLVPGEMRWAAAGIGAARYQTVFLVVLPIAAPSALTGVMLAIARAAGETAPLIFTALFSPFWPNGLMNPIASLSVLVYNFATAPFEPQQEIAWAASLILVLLVLITSVIARAVTTRRTPR